jgi:GTP cyclohydrolase I
MDPKHQEQLARHIQGMLELLGFPVESDPDLERTPQRVATFYSTFFAPVIEAEPPRISLMENLDGLHELIVLRNIRFYSICAHHLLPFFGVVQIGYVPNRQLAGLSSLGAVVDFFARRPQIQERLTEQIVAFLDEVLRPRGVIAHCEARHLCVEMRSHSGDAVLVTSAARGTLVSGQDRAQFLERIRG